MAAVYRSTRTNPGLAAVSGFPVGSSTSSKKYSDACHTGLGMSATIVAVLVRLSGSEIIDHIFEAVPVRTSTWLCCCRSADAVGDPRTRHQRYETTPCSDGGDLVSGHEADSRRSRPNALPRATIAPSGECTCQKEPSARGTSGPRFGRRGTASRRAWSDSSRRGRIDLRSSLPGLDFIRLPKRRPASLCGELCLGRAARSHPLPRYTWELTVEKEARVAEIRTATAWVDFVCAHARIRDDLILPDWVQIAQSIDAIHLTRPVIAAVQEFAFRTRRGVIPAAFWDVDTTFWLRWCFSDARLVETARATPAER